MPQIVSACIFGLSWHEAVRTTILPNRAQNYTLARFEVGLHIGLASFNVTFKGKQFLSFYLQPNYNRYNISTLSTSNSLILMCNSFFWSYFWYILTDLLVRAIAKIRICRVSRYGDKYKRCWLMKRNLCKV